MRRLVLLVLGLVLSGPSVQADDKIQFTKPEAEFLAHLAIQNKQIDVVKALIGISIAASIPTSPAELAEYLVKQSVEASFDVPSVEKTMKDLDTIRCLKNSQDVQLFVEGKHPEVKGKVSGKNRKFFEKLANCYIAKK